MLEFSSIKASNQLNYNLDVVCSKKKKLRAFPASNLNAMCSADLFIFLFT